MKHEQEFEALVARTKALDEEITKANAVEASHKQAFDQLVADVESYNATTKRFDISVERALFITSVPDDPAQDSAQTIQGFGGQPVYYSRHDDHEAWRMVSTGGCNCPSCPPNPPNAPFGTVCVLEVGGSGCNRDCTVRVCSYRCIKTILTPLNS
jgi:hypothetical protein